MQRIKQVSFITLFISMLVIPMVLTLPRVIGFAVPETKSVLNGELTRVFEKFVDDENALKTLSKNLWAAIDYTLFNEGRQGVVIGTKAWLFTDEEIDPVRHSEMNYANNLHTIFDVQHTLAQKQIKLLLVIVPAKARIYADYLPHNTHPDAAHQALFQRVQHDVKNAGIASSDALPALLTAREHEQVFLRTDTHWTAYGASVVADTVATFIKQAHWINTNKQHYRTTIHEQKKHQGDLLNYVPLSPWFDFMNPFSDFVTVQKTTMITDENAANENTLFADARLAVTLVGSSYSANPLWNFTGALQQAIGTELMNVAKEGQGPVKPMLDYLQSDDFHNNPPQVVLWEFPERYLLMSPASNDKK